MERDLREAIEKVDINTVTSILNETPQLIYLKINNQGQLPLTLACEQSNKDLAKVKTLIITLKRAIGLPDMRGVYPIHAIVISNASESNKTKLIEKLLNCGVMEIEGSNKGLLNQKVTRALPRRGAADAIRNRMGMVMVMEGDTALHLAVRNKNIYVVNYLMKEDHIDPNIQNTEGKTPFHIAAKEIYHEGMKDIFETLSNSKSVKLDIVDNDGETAYSIYAKTNPDIN